VVVRNRSGRTAGGTNGSGWVFRLPVRPRGRTTHNSRLRHRFHLEDFAGGLMEIRSRLDFRPGKRGWCYILEEYGLHKGNFDKAEDVIDECRKTGVLPSNFCAEDQNRAAENLESPDRETPEEYVKSWVQTAAESWDQYNPGSFWNFQKVYCEMMVEKIDLRELFGPICAEYHVPIFNARGWSDINSRIAMMLRFKRHEKAGRRCVLLYCGDFDPSGFLISDYIMDNLNELKNAVVEEDDDSLVPVGRSPDNLVIDRFGLNIDFINRHRLTWIDNLETSSGKNLADPDHRDFGRPYVQEYLRKYGARKVEANALVTHPREARQLCLGAIRKYVSLNGVGKYKRWLEGERQKARAETPAALRAAAKR
jgi:hypothetical protein